jgi:ComF family protein
MFKELITPLISLFYPHLCFGCGRDIAGSDNYLCFECFAELPFTGFTDISNNPIEQLFAGRLHLEAATSELYFTKNSAIQNLVHELKYKNNQSVGLWLGKLIGKRLKESGRFEDIDMIIPLPLHRRKERKRGYNQSAIIAMGMADIMSLPVSKGAVIRIKNTESQTKKDRHQRWENVASSFKVLHPEQLSDKHVLLVDDVLTTGATIEACGQAILIQGDVRLSVATLTYAFS